MTTSKSEQVYRSIVDRIRSGDLNKGDKLPTQKELAEHFECSLAPVKQALARLSLEGVTTSSTAGTFIAEAPPAFSGNLLSTHALVQQDPTSFGSDFDERILFADRIEVEGRPAEMLGVEEGTLVIRRDRHRMANGEPITISSAWIPWKFGRHVADLLLLET
ncbi:MAG: GntR family transcriptional regulator, partial [bacterium]|nr:GntR family transcriptional regulator [bacterium]